MLTPLSFDLSFSFFRDPPPGLSPGSHGNTGVGAAPGRQSELAATTKRNEQPPYSVSSTRLYTFSHQPRAVTQTQLRSSLSLSLHLSLAVSAATISSSLCLAAGEAEILAWEEILTGRAPHPWYHPLATHPLWNTATISAGVSVGVRSLRS